MYDMTNEGRIMGSMTCEERSAYWYLAAIYGYKSAKHAKLVKYLRKPFLIL